MNNYNRVFVGGGRYNGYGLGLVEGHSRLNKKLIKIIALWRTLIVAIKSHASINKMSLSLTFGG